MPKSEDKLKDLVEGLKEALIGDKTVSRRIESINVEWIQLGTKFGCGSGFYEYELVPNISIKFQINN